MFTRMQRIDLFWKILQTTISAPRRCRPNQRLDTGPLTIFSCCFSLSLFQYSVSRLEGKKSQPESTQFFESTCTRVKYLSTLGHVSRSQLLARIRILLYIWKISFQMILHGYCLTSLSTYPTSHISRFKIRKSQSSYISQPVQMAKHPQSVARAAAKIFAAERTPCTRERKNKNAGKARRSRVVFVYRRHRNALSQFFLAIATSASRFVSSLPVTSAS